MDAACTEQVLARLQPSGLLPDLQYGHAYAALRPPLISADPLETERNCSSGAPPRSGRSNPASICRSGGAWSPLQDVDDKGGEDEEGDGCGKGPDPRNMHMKNNKGTSKTEMHKHISWQGGVCRATVLHGGWLEDGGMHAWVDGKDAGLVSSAPAIPPRFSYCCHVLTWSSASGDLIMAGCCMSDSSCTSTNEPIQYSDHPNKNEHWSLLEFQMHNA